VTAAAVQLRRVAVDAIRRLCVVPERLTVTEWADRYRMLPETSTSPGPYDSSITPYARRPQDCLADPSIDTVVLCWAAQTTKSTVLENGIAYRICRMPAPMVVVLPKIDAAEAWARERFDPMVSSTKALRDRIVKRLSLQRYKKFAGGFLFMASAQSATELASRSSSFVLCDEVDRYENLPGEGNPVEIVARRGGAADVGLLALTSTPRDEESTVIWPYLEAGTFELYHMPCPHCGTMQPLVWKGPRGDFGLRWDKGKPGAAYYLCGVGLETEPDGSMPGCGGVIEHGAKRGMLAAGEWIPTNPEASYPSFHLNALYSPFAKTSWAAVAAAWESAQGKSAKLQVFVNTFLAETWKETTDVVASDGLLQRLEPMEEGMVPDGVAYLTAGIDVQANRLEVYVWGWGGGLTSWLVASVILFGDPEREAHQPGSVWARLDEYLAHRFPHVAGGELPIAAALMDSGYSTTQVYRFVRRKAARRIHASKGVGGHGVPILGKPSLQGKDRIALYPVGVDTAKTEFLRSQLLEQNATEPGFVHLPTWISTDQVEQLVAEVRKRRVTRKGLIYEWRKKTEDTSNEALDCRVYARAALEMLGAKVIARLGAKAAEVTAAGVALTAVVARPEVASGEPVRRAAPRRQSSWVEKWRR
jgi:phage terminase large subunit GpA-like protein